MLNFSEVILNVILLACKINELHPVAFSLLHFQKDAIN